MYILKSKVSIHPHVKNFEPIQSICKSFYDRMVEDLVELEACDTKKVGNTCCSELKLWMYLLNSQ